MKINQNKSPSQIRRAVNMSRMKCIDALYRWLQGFYFFETKTETQKKTLRRFCPLISNRSCQCQLYASHKTTLGTLPRLWFVQSAIFDMTDDKINRVQWASISSNKNAFGRSEDEGGAIILRMIHRDARKAELGLALAACIYVCVWQVRCSYANLIYL